MFLFILSCTSLKFEFNNKLNTRDEKFINAVVQLKPTDEISKLLEDGADPETLFEDGDHALIIAIKNKRADLIDLLLKQKNKAINLINREKLTPLMVAVQFVDLDSVKKIIENGVILVIENANGDTALELALLSFIDDKENLGLKEEIVITLLNKIRTDILCQVKKSRLLKLICSTSNIKILEEFLKKIKITEEFDNEFLFSLIESGEVNLLKVILEHNPDISLDISNKDGHLFLLAIKTGKKELIEILIDKINNIGTKEEAAIGLLSLLNLRYNAAIKMLLDKIVEIKAVQGVHPIIVAAEKCDETIIEMLFKKGVDINLSYNGVTPLIAAIKSKNVKVVQKLVSMGVNIGFQEGIELPIFVAARIDVKSLRILLKAGADIDVMIDGVTPFLAAARADNVESVRELLRENVNYHISKEQVLLLKNEVYELINFLNLYKSKQLIDSYEIRNIIKAIEEDKKLVGWLSNGDAPYRSIEGITPLMYGAIKGYYAYVLKMKGAGAHYQARDIRGLTALDYALEELINESSPQAQNPSAAGLIAVVKFLLDLYKRDLFSEDDIKNLCRLSIHVKDEDLFRLIFNKVGENGRVKILIAASREGKSELIQKIFELDPNMTADDADEQGNTALMYSYNLKVFEYLVDVRKGSLKAEDKVGTNVLMKLVQGRSDDLEEILKKLLLLRSIPIDHQDKEGRTALMYASMSGSWKGVNFLLLVRANVYLSDIEGRTALMYAASNCSSEIVKGIITSGGSEKSLLDAKDKKGKTVLMYSVRKAGFECVKTLLNEGADFRLLDNKGRDILIHTSINGAVELLDLILEKGLNLGIIDNNGMTCLMHAIKNNRLEMVKELIEREVNILIQDSKGKNALMYAAELEEIDIIEELLKHKDINLEVEDVDGKTAIMYSVIKSRFRTLELLLDKGGKKRVKDKNQVTLLMYGLRQGNRGLTEFLINQFKDDFEYLDCKDVNGKSALMYAIQNGDRYIVEKLLIIQVMYTKQELLNCFYSRNNLDVLKFLISSGTIDFKEEVGSFEIFKEFIYNLQNSLRSDYSGTLLMLAVENGNQLVTKILLNLGVDINLKNENGLTASMLAIKNGYASILDDLILKGANINLKDEIVNSQFVEAIKSGNIESVKLFLRLGVNPLIIVDNKTTLMYATEANSYDLVELLLENIGNNLKFIDQQDQNGETALVYAVKQDNEEITSLLLNAAANSNGALIAAVNNRKIKITKFILINNLFKIEERKRALEIATEKRYDEFIQILRI